MKRTYRLQLGLAVLAILASTQRALQADSVLDWNATIRAAAQDDGNNAVNKANPGWFTRGAAMMNGAIYDVFQAISRTHQPFLVNTSAPGASLDAAVHRAAYKILKDVYPGESAILDADYNARMALVGAGAAKDAGIALGDLVSAAYIANRSGDHSGDMIPYMTGTGPGQWRPDPFHPAQQAWGPGWGAVQPFAIGATDPFIAALPPIPALSSQAYADAYNQVKAYGDVNSVVRTTEQEDIALFWAYDRATMGPPPVLFNRSMAEIAAQTGNTADENARLFAMGSVAMADAAIASWDAKFTYNFWRPVGAIHEAGDDGSGFDDGNPNTVGDANWRPMGAPGGDPNDVTDDFTPPFPAWTSGHATMGGAVFKALELFYGTNSFDAINGVLGDDLTYALTSQEFGASGSAGMMREFSSFTQTGVLDVGMENSPEGENGTSRIYLGIHWIFDQRDGVTLGNEIASFIAANAFQAVPEPGSLAVAATGLICLASRRKRS